MTERKNNYDNNNLSNLQSAEVGLPRHETMGLDTAKTILEAVIGTHEKTLTENSDLTSVGSFSMNQVRSALSVVSQDIISSCNERYTSKGFTTTSKDTPFGTLSITIFKKINNDLTYAEPENLNMTLLKRTYILECEIPLMQSDSWVRQDSIRFSDFRKGTNVVSMYQIKKQFSIEKYRHIWRGFRWLSANLLNWDREFVIPEDLDNPMLPKISNLRLLK